MGGGAGIVVPPLLLIGVVETAVALVTGVTGRIPAAITLGEGATCVISLPVRVSIVRGDALGDGTAGGR